MPWRFDAQAVDLVFIIDTSVPIASGNVDFGNEITSDLSIDTGDRTNDTSIIDNGLRIIDGSI